MWPWKRKVLPEVPEVPQIVSGTKLEGDCRGRDLSGIRFHNAQVEEADLRDAILRGADLTGAVGLSKPQLGGTDLTGAKLPVGFGWSDELSQVAETSKNAATLFLTQLGLCAYVLLTVATTTDAGLLADAATSQLPLVSVAVPITRFYLAAPVVLLAVYLYYQLYMLRLWEGLAELPAIFPDGQRLDRKIPPWLINGLVNAHFARLRKDPPSYSWLQALVAGALSWWLVPATLLALWFRYQVRHDLMGTLWLCFVVSVAMVVPNELGSLSASFLRHQDGLRRVLFANVKPWLFWLIRLLYPVTFVAVVAQSALNCGWTKSKVPRIVASVVEADVSQKPPGWTGQDSKQFPLVKGAQLGRLDLRGLKARRAFLVNADFRDANLTGADFQGALLAKARFSGPRSDLSKVEFFGADLRGAALQGLNLAGLYFRGATLDAATLDWSDLTRAKLPEASMRRTSIRGADLTNTNLRGANLTGANLSVANLTKANLEGANLARANLTAADLIEATLFMADLTGTDLDRADLTGADLTGANLEAAHIRVATFVRANFTEATLFMADLRGANLTGADFTEADLTEADLVRADLVRADLRGANLHGTNFTEAKYNQYTRWPKGFDPVKAGAIEVGEGGYPVKQKPSRPGRVRARP